MTTRYVKAFTPHDFKLDESGAVTVAFAQLNVVDRDLDVTLPGAFPAKEVPMSAYGHTTWDGALPLGKGMTGEQGDWGVFHGQFFMDTEQGRNGHATVRAMGDLQEWSYGYDALEFSFGSHEGKSVRFLKRQDVYEVSPVLRGSGIATRTLDIKSAKGATPFADLPIGERMAAFDRGMADPGLRKWASSDGSGDKDKMDWAKYRKGFFWSDEDAPEDFGSYKLIFGQVIDGTLTAMPRGIFLCAAVMQGARGGVDIPTADRAAVQAQIARYYAKMATAFNDDGITPPWENKGVLGFGATFADHLDWTLDEAEALFNRVEDRIDLRAKEGRMLSAASMERLMRMREMLDAMIAEASPPKRATLDVLLATARRLGVAV